MVVGPLGDTAHVTLFIRTVLPAQRGTSVRPPITAHETDVRHIAGVFEPLKPPLPPRITLHLYPSAELLAAGLVDDAGLQPIVARTMGRFAAGVAFDDTLLLLEPEFRRFGVARMTVERDAVVTIASEGVATTRPSLDLDQIAEPRHFLEHGGSTASPSV